MNHRCYCIVLFFLLLFGVRQNSFGVSGVAPHGDNLPWFTGPLLTPTARVISLGNVNLEPYLFYTVNTGHYNDDWKAKSKPKFYQINPQLQCKFGIMKDVDFSIAPQSYISWTKGRVGSGFGDLPVGIDYQMYHGEKDSLLTFVKLSIQVTIPTGRFKKLNPRNLGTDIGGAGTYATQIGIGFSKLLEFEDGRYMNNRFFIATTLSTPVHVKGLSAYGGAPGTHGTVHPGTAYAFLAGTEYMLTKNWTLACDIQFAMSNKTRFSGRTDALVGDRKSAQLSIAPAIEYNWSDSLGLIVGPWFTLAGKNSAQFYSLVAALNYVY